MNLTALFCQEQTITLSQSCVHPTLDLFLLQSFWSAWSNSLPYYPHHASFVNRQPRVLVVREQSCIATPQHFLLDQGLNVSGCCSSLCPLCLYKNRREAVCSQSALCYVVRRKEMSVKAKPPQFTAPPYGVTNMCFEQTSLKLRY